MSLIACKECKKQISDEAKTCPSCGAKVPQPMSRLKILFLGLFAIIVAKAAFTDRPDSPPPRTKTPAEIASEQKKEADFQFAVLGTKLIRQSLKNPKSFELVSASLVDKGAVCVTYRATNSFNAIITEQAAVTRNLQRGSWNKDCGGKLVDDVSYLRHAL